MLNGNKCEKYIDYILAGELSEQGNKDLEEHLKVCPSCRAALAFLDNVETELSLLPEVTPDLVDSVMKAVGRGFLKASPSLAYRKGGFNSGVNLWPLAGIAGFFAILTALLGIYIGVGGGETFIVSTFISINIQTFTIVLAVSGSILVAGAALLYSRLLMND